MSTTRPWLVWVVLAGVFLAGGVAGGFTSLRVAKALVDRGRGPEQFAPRHLERLTEGLKLTEIQQAQVQPILERTWEELRQHRRSSIETMRTMEQNVMAVLDPEQRVAYAEMQEKQRERWQKLMERRGKSHGDKDEKRDGPPRGPLPDSSPPAP